MKYVHCFFLYDENVSILTMEGVLIEEKAQSFFVSEPLLYEWLFRQERLDWIHQAKRTTFDKKEFKYLEIDIPSSLSHSWILDFPLFESDRDNVSLFYSFFELFLKKSDLSFVKKLEMAVSDFKERLDCSSLKRIVSFIVENHPHEQVRVALSSSLLHVLN